MTVKSCVSMWREHQATMELTLGRPTLISSHDASLLPGAQHEDNASKIEAYLHSLEDERRKIEAFKRELPICMRLLSSEIEASRIQLCAGKHDDTHKKDKSAAGEFSATKPPALCKADFIISNILNSYREEPNSCESWSEDEVHPQTPILTSCWKRGEPNTIEDQEEASAMASKLYKTRTTGSSCEDDSQACNNVFRTRPGGAFVPFLKEKRMKLIDEATEPESPPATDHQDGLHNTTELNGAFIAPEGGASYQQFNEPFPPARSLANNGPSNQPSPHRKPRRCWSAELHRKFVHALKQLGGPEVATPKQIREVMQVDGLTNDEVKSHLQKYRLHTKRPNPTNNMHIPAAMTQTTTGTAAPQLLVLGGIWVPQDYPLKQPLYMNSVSQIMDPSLLKQAGQPFGNQNLNIQT